MHKYKQNQYINYEQKGSKHAAFMNIKLKRHVAIQDEKKISYKDYFFCS